MAKKKNRNDKVDDPEGEQRDNAVILHRKTLNPNYNGVKSHAKVSSLANVNMYGPKKLKMLFTANRGNQW